MKREPTPESAPVRGAGEVPMALHVLRVVRGWNQSELGRAAGVRPSAVSDYEHGKKAPELASLTRLLSAMGYQLSTLDEARAFIRQTQGGGVPEPATSSRLLALEVGNAIARLAAALLERRR